ncbi:hypothetical protein AB0873_16700 [Micromonospora sp. NPDC047707]|uniref:hypothetical protein n=1 Tax=Micromonospora sp. NPDC047707 TaxID=3154498 RepID=UPI003454FC0A
MNAAVVTDRPDLAAVALALAEIRAGSNARALRFTGSRLARELTARTGHDWTAEEVGPAVLAAAPALAETWGVYLARVRDIRRRGRLYQLTVRPPETPGDPRR